MVLSKTFEPPDLLVATLSGVVTSRDQMEIVAWVRESIQVLGSVRVLVRLTQFSGWHQDPKVGDASAVWLQDDESVSKLAIVGDRKWRLAVLTVIAQPLRRIPIEFFDKEIVARGWLSTERTNVQPADRNARR